MSISASPLAIGKPHSVILHQLPRLAIRLRGLQITQGKFIHTIFLLHRHDGAICLIQVGMPGPEYCQLVVARCPVYDRLNPLALFSPEIEPTCLGLDFCDGRSHIGLGVTCCCRFYFIERQIHLGHCYVATP